MIDAAISRTARRIVDLQREELRRRQAILRDALVGFDVQTLADAQPGAGEYSLG